MVGTANDSEGGDPDGAGSPSPNPGSGLQPEARGTSDRQLDALADALAQAFSTRGKGKRRTRAVVRLALEFSTWAHLTSEGLSDPDAAGVMAHAARAAGS